MLTQYLTYLKRAAITLLAVGLFVACDALSDFGDTNTNPTQVSESVPEFQLTTIQLSVAGTRFEMWRAQLLYGGNVVQHLVNTFYGGGNNYNENTAWATAFWNTAYSGSNDASRAQVKNVEDLIANLERRKEEGDDQVDNFLAMGRILRAYIYHRITDLYGEAPYTEAGRGALDQEFTPAYDTQQAIYDDMFVELGEAVQQFDAAQLDPGSNDLLYESNIVQWQRFANSLRLRLALRLVKVDPTKAQAEAQAALNAPGGVMTGNEDMAVILHATGPNVGPNGLNSNPISDATLNGGGDQEYLAETFVDWMVANNDPRLEVYGQTGKPALGFPSGHNTTTIVAHPSYPGGEDPLDSYTRINELLLDRDDPTFLLTYAEVEFMLAELAVRGWAGLSPVEAPIHYNAGIRAAMEQLSMYDPEGGGTTISDGDITSYIATNPLNGVTEDAQLEQIGEQYWAAVFLNGIEAWSNWRRSGYPDLQPATVDGGPPPGNSTGGAIPRRLVYPAGIEDILNTENYQAAIARQGPNTLTTRVWWDAE